MKASGMQTIEIQACLILRRSFQRKKERKDLALKGVLVHVHVSTLTFIGISNELLFECEGTREMAERINALTARSENLS